MAEKNQTTVVTLANAKVNDKGRRFSVAYRCPRCRAVLESRDGDILKTDTCPNCGMGFVFDDAVKAKYTAGVAAKQQAAADAAARDASHESIEQERDADEDRKRKTKRVESLADVNLMVGVTLSVYLVGAIFSIFVALIMLAGMSKTNQEYGVSLIGAAVALLLVLPLIDGLFRCLTAIHALLLRIARATEKAGSASEE